MPEANVAIKKRCLERVLFNKVMALFHMTVMYHHSLEVNPQLPEIECLTSKPELRKALEKQFSDCQSYFDNEGGKFQYKYEPKLNFNNNRTQNVCVACIEHWWPYCDEKHHKFHKVFQDLVLNFHDYGKNNFDLFA